MALRFEDFLRMRGLGPGTFTPPVPTPRPALPVPPPTATANAMPGFVGATMQRQLQPPAAPAPPPVTPSSYSPLADPRQMRRFQQAGTAQRQQWQSASPPPREFVPLESLTQLTEEQLALLPADLQQSVATRAEQLAANPNADPNVVAASEQQLLLRINSELDRRGNLTPDQIAIEDAERSGAHAPSLGEGLLGAGAAILGVLDAPRQMSVRRAGEDAYRMVTTGDQSAIGDFLTWFPGKTDFEAWMRDPANAAIIKNAYENGYTADNGMSFTGGHAVWEVFINGQDRWHRTVYDLAYDPLTYAGAATSAGKGLEAVGEGTRILGQSGRTGVASAPLTGIGGALETAGRLAQVPDAAFNAAADNLVGGALGLASDSLSRTRLGGFLMRESTESAGRTAGQRATDAARARRAIMNSPSGAPAPTTNIGGVPEPTPILSLGPGGEIAVPPKADPNLNKVNVTKTSILGDLLQPQPNQTPALGSGELPLQGPTDPRLLPTGETPIEVGQPRIEDVQPLFGGQSGERQPFTPGEDVGLRDFTEPPIPEVPVTPERRNLSYVGENKEFRIRGYGDGDNRRWEVSPQKSGGGYGKIVSGPHLTYDEAVADAVSRVRGEAIPEPTTPRPNVPEQTTLPEQTGQPTPDLPEPTMRDVPNALGEPAARQVSGMSAEQRAEAIRSGRISAMTPQPGGDRLLDRALSRSLQFPETKPNYDAVIAEITPAIKEHNARQAALELKNGGPKYPDIVDNGGKILSRGLDEKVARQAMNGVETTVGTIAPAVQKHYPGEVIDLRPTEPRVEAATASGKASFREESMAYLIERAVYDADDDALAAVKGRLKGRPKVIDEITTRIEAARAALTEQFGGANPGQGMTGMAGDAARWFFLNEPPITEATRQAPTQYNPDPRLTDDVRAALEELFTQHPDYKGQTVGQVNEALEAAARADQEEIRRLLRQGYTDTVPDGRAPRGGVGATTFTVKTGETTGPRGKVRDVTERRTAQTTARPGERVAELRRKWIGAGDIEKDDPGLLADKQVGFERRVDINPRATRRLPLLADLFVAAVYRLPRHELLANPALSWAYSMRNIMSNTALSMLALHGQDISPLKALAPREIWRSRNPAYESAALRMEAGLGVSGALPSELTSNVRTSSLDTVPKGQDTATRDLFRKLKIKNRDEDYRITRAYDWKRDWDHRTEVAMKVGGVYAPALESFVREEIDTVAAQVAGAAANRNLPFGFEQISRDLWGLRNADGVFSPNDVYDLLYRRATEAGVEPGVAEAYAKIGHERWMGAARRARQRSVDLVNRAFPSGKMTNADRYASYFFLFHLWPTRAAKFVLEEMVRDPRIILWWQRAHEGLDKMAEDEHYPASARGLIKLAMSPLGLQLYANPSALYVLSQLRPSGPDYPDPMGETQLGHGLKWLEKKTGLTPTPVFDALFNAAGVYGDDFLPDPVPSPTRQLVGAAIDAVMAYTGNGLGSPEYQRVTAKARAIMSGKIPGTSEVPYVDPADRRNDPVANAVLLQDPDLAARYRSSDPKVQADAFAELGEIMDPEGDDPRRIEAEKVVAGSGIITTILSRFSPLGVRAKNPVREEIIEAGRAGRAVPYEQRTPQQQADVVARAGTTTDPAVMGVKAQQDQYGALGTDRQQQINDGWRLLAYGTEDEFMRGSVVLLNGRAYTPGQLTRLDPDERRALADQWVSKVNGTEELEELRTTQQEFKDKNVDYAAYTDWAKAGRDFPGGVTAYREALMAISPSYKKYIKQLPNKTLKDPAKLDEESITLDAYLASKGQKVSVYDADLGSAGDGPLFNAIAGLVQSSGGFGGGKQYSDTPEGRLSRLKDNLTEYQTKMKIYDDAVMKETGGIGFDQLAPQFAETYQRRLEQKGISKPSRPELVGVYLQWKAVQPPGADTRPEAFSAWFEGYRAQAA